MAAQLGSIHSPNCRVREGQRGSLREQHAHFGIAEVLLVFVHMFVYIFHSRSEEIFDFSQDKLTSQKTMELKQSLTQQFALIYQFCEWVLQVSLD